MGDATPLRARHGKRALLTVTEGSAHCEVVSKCITTHGVGDHGNDVLCTVRAEEAVLVRATVFDTESCCDFVTIAGKRYSGSSWPDALLSKGATLMWHRNGSVMRGGFMICAELAPAVAALAAQTESASVRWLQAMVEPTPVPARRRSSAFFADRAALLVARDAWCANSTAATMQYGAIGTWDVSAVVDLSFVFCAAALSTRNEIDGCNSECLHFNDDISAWNTSKVSSLQVCRSTTSSLTPSTHNLPHPVLSSASHHSGHLPRRY
jgi:hypothetical protein